MLYTLVEDYYQLTNGIMLFSPVFDQNGKIKDFAWNCISHKEGKNHYMLGENPREKSIELFNKYVNVFNTGETEEIIFDLEGNDDKTVWYRTTVAKFENDLIVSCTNITNQKEAEKQLQKSEENYRLLAENSTDMICRFNLQSQFLYVSPSAKRILGYTPEELLGQSFYKYVHPDDIEATKKQNIRMLEEHTISTIQFRFRKKDNTYTWIETITKPILQADGKTIEVQSSVRSISERKKLENKLYKINNELENRMEKKTSELNAILENAPIILWGVNKDEIITFSKGKGLDLLGLEQGEVSGMSIKELYKDYPEVIDNIRKALNGDPFEGILMFKDRYYQEYFFPVKNTDGAITGMAAIATDITDQEIAQKRLATSEVKYKSMVDGIPQLVWTATSYGEIDFVNRNYYEYTGQGHEEALKNGWMSVIHPDDIPGIQKKLKVAIETGQMLIFEARYRRASDGQYRWHLVRVWGASNELGEVIKWLGSATDIHDQKSSYEALAAKNKELERINNDLDNFIYTASHDLRAPISNMEGLIIAIQKELNDACEEDISTMLKMTEESLLRLRATINELTEISQVQKNIDADVEKINITEIIDNFKKEYRQEIINVDADIKTRLDVKELNFSRKNFKTVMYNLLSNAIKYKHPQRPPRVLVKTEKTEDNYILLSITDNGLGIKEGDTEKMFGMFKRLHTHVEGTGIGLYIVKKVIQNIGGKIEVESKLREGSTFKVYLKSI